MKIAYYEKSLLRIAGAVAQDEPDEVQGTLLVADINICEWTSDHSQYGCNYNYMYPAFHNGEKCFLITSEWEPAQGYCAEGTQDSIFSFEEGMEILLKQNAYEWMWKNPEESTT